MKNESFLALGLLCVCAAACVPCKTVVDDADSPRDLIAPPQTQTDSSITLLWDKPAAREQPAGYIIFKDGKAAAETSKSNATIDSLAPETSYSFAIQAKYKNGSLSSKSEISVSTRKRGKVFNVLDFGAVGDGKTLNTKAIQKAIDACDEGGTVCIPKGTFLSGALFLKSDMTLYIEKDGVLLGSQNIKDYEPMILTRFEGWELKSFASLITAGKLDNGDGCNVKNISLRGEGTIRGGGTPLGKAMIEAAGMRGRGRLVCLMNCENADIQGLLVDESPCWTIHYTYSKNITCRDLNIVNKTANGDGIDPDSSVNSYIFNCRFDVGDDCIAIKSGKNPEGYYIGRPTLNVFVSDCDFFFGHGVSIGSEMSGGVRNVVVRDSKLGKLNNGMYIKGTKERGGYVEDVYVRNCDLQKITIRTAIGYNNDGEGAPKSPWFKNLVFENITMTSGDIKKPLILADGFDDNFTSDALFKNIVLPKGAEIKINRCKNFAFENVREADGSQPKYIITNSENIKKP